MSDRRPEADWAGQRGAEQPSLVEQIKALSDAMTAAGVTDLEFTDGPTHITLRRQPHVVAAGPAVALSGGAAPPVAAREPASEPAEFTLAVMSPLTGVFYNSPSPALPPFVGIGEQVQPGQVVCIVEAMKVFNEIKTEIGGTVVAMPPKSGQLVKKGDPLVRIKPL